MFILTNRRAVWEICSKKRLANEGGECYHVTCVAVFWVVPPTHQLIWARANSAWRQPDTVLLVLSGWCLTFRWHIKHFLFLNPTSCSLTPSFLFHVFCVDPWKWSGVTGVMCVTVFAELHSRGGYLRNYLKTVHSSLTLSFVTAALLWKPPAANLIKAVYRRLRSIKYAFFHHTLL